eukprot:CAMPEP_0184301914 /NCGR_PEP_ID=MMETSP1049-20130417/12020_1 /TAXON_ID=77928 /ORGANISM="Proteomonas sulcata, Strain CCMP704" /LENGTH=87 /DNA_ID=CAMNT_0026613057 /DNA_START=484 /DNA_END=747 /DNA_ORIENTATION=-
MLRISTTAEGPTEAASLTTDGTNPSDPAPPLTALAAGPERRISTSKTSFDSSIPGTSGFSGIPECGESPPLMDLADPSQLGDCHPLA